MEKKDLALRFVMMFTWLLLLLIISCTFSGCGASLVQKGEESKETNTTTNTQQEVSGTKTDFDKSIFETEQKDFVWEPLDPSKEMQIRDNGTSTNTTNARKRYTSKNTKTQLDKESTEANKTETDTTATEEIKDNKSWYQKIKISVPWYAYFIVGFFLVLLFVLWKLNKKIEKISL